MFTIAAIHHNHVRIEDVSIGTMHLNALNGSSDVLGYNDSHENNCSCPSPLFGGIIGVSLSENHPYRPQDSGMTFHESSKISHKKSTSSSASSPNGHNSSTSDDSSEKSDLRCTDAMATLRGTETASPVGPRRHSYDLDLVSASAKHHCRYDDRSLSLDELIIGPLSRFGRFLDGTIDEYEQTSDPDLAGLSLTEVSVNTTKDQDSCQGKDIVSKSLQTKKKNKRSHTSDFTMSEKALRFLEKIKDSRRDHYGNFKHSHHRSDHTHHKRDDIRHKREAIHPIKEDICLRSQNINHQSQEVHHNKEDFHYKKEDFKSQDIKTTDQITTPQSQDIHHKKEDIHLNSQNIQRQLPITTHQSQDIHHKKEDIHLNSQNIQRQLPITSQEYPNHQISSSSKVKTSS